MYFIHNLISFESYIINIIYNLYNTIAILSLLNIISIIRLSIIGLALFYNKLII